MVRNKYRKNICRIVKSTPHPNKTQFENEMYVVTLILEVSWSNCFSYWPPKQKRKGSNLSLQR